MNAMTSNLAPAGLDAFGVVAPSVGGPTFR